VYIPPDEEFSYAAWCRNLAAGRAFLSGGPMLEFSIDGAQIGDTLQLPAGGGTVEVRATAESVLPVPRAPVSAGRSRAAGPPGSLTPRRHLGRYLGQLAQAGDGREDEPGDGRE
jgi:hypothetical protein